LGETVRLRFHTLYIYRKSCLTELESLVLREGITVTMADQLSKQPPSSSSFILSYPAQYVLLVTINRPDAMNSIPSYSHWEAHSLFDWFDQEPSLRVAVITGAGPKAFCAGQDLVEQAQFKVKPPPESAARHPPSGFCGISRRVGKKPIIAAVNGFALGGGFEICLNW
jgi:enoyl-CoA hydratase/carnithine racemase